MSRYDSMIVNWAGRILARRWAIVLGTLGCLLLFGLGAFRLTLDKSYRVWFDEDDPSLLNYDALQDTYAKSDSVLFAIAPEDGDVFSVDNLRAVAELTAQAWELPYNSRVESLTNFQYSRAEEDELVVGNLVENPEELTAEQATEVRKIALADPLLRNKLVSADGRVTGINVTMNIPAEDPDALDDPEGLGPLGKTVKKVRQLAASFEASHPGIELHLTGVVLLDYAFEENTKRDMMTLWPLMFVAIVVVMFVLLRSSGGTVASLSVIFLSALSALAFGGWIGIALTPPSVVAPIMIMTLAVADTIHLLVTMLKEMRAGRTKDDAIVESLRLNFNPVMITSLTTTIGFLSLNFSDSRPFRDLGNMTAAGTMVAFFLSVTFLPALLSLLPIRPRESNSEPGQAAATPLISRFAEFVIRRSRWLLYAGVAIVVFLAVMIPRNRLDDRWVEYFAPGIEFRTDSEFVMENLTGIYLMEYSLDSGEPSGIGKPEYLTTVENFRRWYERQPGVVHVMSYSEIAMRLNKHLHGDDPAFYRVPETRELGAQYHLLYSMSLPMGLGLNNRVNIDVSATRFTVTIANLTTVELRKLSARADEWLKANTPPAMHAVPTSPSVMFSHVSERNLKQMVYGTVVALALITLALIFALKSLPYGLVSLIPNLVPAVAGLGIWALWRGEIGLSLSTVTTMTLGIVVDDTVHFLSKYLRGRREKGLSAADAVRYAFATVGTALFVTSVILAAGFLVLAISSYRLNAWMGQLASVTIVAALAADFLLLPPLLLRFEELKSRIFDRKNPERDAEQSK